MGNILFLALTSAASVAINAIGFTPAGIAAGSIAACIQSCIGDVVVGSVFAAVQSLAATGTIATVGVASGGAALALAAGA